MPELDLLITNVEVVGAGAESVPTSHIGVRAGKIVGLSSALEPGRNTQVIQGDGLLAFPGAVDAHQHWGIYNPMAKDTWTESRAAAQGGVTTGLTYTRTGQYYLNQGGPYKEFMPKVLKQAEGNAFVDYAFHVAPMMREHIDEIPTLIQEFGVTSFKIFMFYGGFGLHGASDSQREFLMTPPDESYDIAHFEFVMRGVQAARERFPELAGDISLSLHCETAEIMRAYSAMVEHEGRLTGLEAYSASRPPHSEGLAIAIASYLAGETGLPTVNLLHLSSRKALEAALLMADAFPTVDFRREVTIGHLLSNFNTASSPGGKVNPPLRSPEDVEYLWECLAAGNVDWVVSDHACCRDEMKFGSPREDVFLAKSGFGGAEYLLPGLVSEGMRRGVSLARIAELTSTNPAKRFGLHSKGRLEEGYDADIALIDPSSPWTVRAADSESSQEYTPFEGFEMAARVVHTFLRGEHIVREGKLVGAPAGRYLSRPTPRPGTEGSD